MKPLACKPELPGGAGCRRHSPVKPAPLQSVPTERRGSTRQRFFRGANTNGRSPPEATVFHSAPALTERPGRYGTAAYRRLCGNYRVHRLGRAL